MVFKLIALLAIYCIETKAIQVLIYNNVYYSPNDRQSYLNPMRSVSSQNACICQCYSNSSCFTAFFIGIKQVCILYSAYLSEGQLRTLLDVNASVMSFPDRTRIQKNPPDTIQWLFDGNFNDVYGQYNGYLGENNTALWISPGYNGNGQAVYLPSRNYSIVNHYLNLISTSFTFSAWIWIPSNGSSSHHGYFILIAHCESRNSYKCLHVGIVDGKLYLGFYDDDLAGRSSLQLDQWYHVVYIYDSTLIQRSVYLNGIADKSDTVSHPYTGNASYLTLGAVPLFTTTPFSSGYVDRLTFVSRAKNVSEILEEATLVAYYSFDNTYTDSGPNQINNSTGINTFFNSTGRINQALVIAGSTGNSAYFQANGFYFLGKSNKLFSFALWIYPYLNSGTIVQILLSSGIYVPIIGFSTTNILTIQIPNGNSACDASFSSGTIPLNTWTHIGMVYSSTDGIELFVNGLSVGVAGTYTNYQANGNYTTVILGYSLRQNSYNSLSGGTIAISEFRGQIDELKIFSRALTATEMYQLSLF